MSHKQAGFAAAETDQGYVAILHKTTVLQKTNGLLKFNSGGWITASTCKAMNGALGELNLKHKYFIRRKLGELFLETTHTNGVTTTPFNGNKLEVKL